MHPPHQIPDLFLSMQKCIDDIKSWMTLNKVKLNDDKTEAMIVSSGRKSTSLFFLPRLYNCTLSDSVKNLGVTLDCHLTMKTRVSNLVRSANFELRCISSIRHLLSTDATKTLVSAFVLSRLDYCNSLLFGCPQYLLNKLQKVQNNAARLVLRVSKTDHISHHLASLHWLPIDSRIQYKLFSLCYNCLNSTAPDYLTELLRICKPTHQLRSFSDTSIFSIPTVHTHSIVQPLIESLTSSPQGFDEGLQTVGVVSCLEHSSLRNQVIQHHLILQIIT